MIEKIKAISILESKNIYKINKNYEEIMSELEKNNNIIYKNIDIFNKILIIITDILDKNNSLKSIKIKYDILVENNNGFDIFISKIIIWIFNKNNTLKNRKIDLEDEKGKNLISISRYDFMNNFVDYIKKMNIVLSENKTYIFLDINKLQFLSIIILNELTDKKIINKTLLNFSGKDSKIFYEMPNLIGEFILYLYKTPFKKINYTEKDTIYIINSTIHSLYEVNKLNNKTGSRFFLSDNQILDELNNSSIYIDKPDVLYVYTEFCKENGIFLDNLEDLENLYFNLINKFNELLKKNNIGTLSILQKKVSILHKAIMYKKIYENIENNVEYFLPYLIDFRGRLYKLSSLSPTFYKELRITIRLKNKNKKFKKEEKEEITKLEEKVNTIILKNKNLLLNLNMYIKTSNERQIWIIWVLISIGILYKNTMASEVKIDKIIEKGIEVINKYDDYIEKLKFDEKLVLYSLKNCLSDIIFKKEKNRTISKDATASVYQHLVKILGGSEESYKIVNLDSEDTYYDTYRKIVETWDKDDGDEMTVDMYFIRENVKKIMMTENYGCGRIRSWNYFTEKTKLKRENKNYKQVKKIFNKFYSFLSKNCIYKKNVNFVIDHILKQNGVIRNNIDGSWIDIMYKKKKTIRRDTVFDNKRMTYTKNETLMLDFDIEKTKIAIPANYTHFQDASLAREIIKRIKTIAIHDCFMVSYKQTSKLIAITNFIMNNSFDDTYDNKKYMFSIFILV